MNSVMAREAVWNTLPASALSVLIRRDSLNTPQPFDRARVPLRSVHYRLIGAVYGGWGLCVRFARAPRLLRRLPAKGQGDVDAAPKTLHF